MIKYHQQILSHIPNDKSFEPYLTFYLNEQVSLEDLQEAKRYPFILGAKLYPVGVTTHSEEGAKSIKSLYPLFEALQFQDLVLQIHGEVNNADIFKREALFIDLYLKDIAKNFPKLRIVLEHISTQAAVEYILSASDHIAATITPQHLLFNRNDLLANGIKPHYYCLPILKKSEDQIALQKAAISGSPKFFAGTDSAPHSRQLKESACGCAGTYSSPYALFLYAEIFTLLGQFEKLENFLSRFGAEFYRLPVTREQIHLIKKEQIIPGILNLGQEEIVPLASGARLQWSLYET